MIHGEKSMEDESRRSCHRGGTMAEKSWRNPGGSFWEMESQKRKLGGGITEEASGLMDQETGIGEGSKEDESWSQNHGGIMEMES